MRVPQRSHLLVLSTEFPPSLSVGALRPGALIRFAAARDWTTTVIALAPARLPAPIQRGSATRHAGQHATRVIRIDPRRIPDDPPSMPATAQWFVMALEMFYRGRSRLRRDPPDAIIATGPGFHTFIAGYFLSRFFAAPLILDYRDEWTLRPRFPWVRVGADDRRWEKRCLAAAARVFFVTRSLREQHLRAFPTLERRRCRVVLNGWDPGDFRLRAATFPSRQVPALMRIGYLGFMADHQPPRRFLQSIERLIESRRVTPTALRIRIVGIVDGTALDALTQFRYPTVLEPHRWVDRPRAAKLMMQCSALLIINEPAMCRALPTKLFDYLASGRPILVFGDADSEMARLVARLGAGLCVPEGDDDRLHRALECFRGSPPPRWQTAARLRFLQRHTREAMATRMLDEARTAIREHLTGLPPPRPHEWTPAALRSIDRKLGIPTEMSKRRRASSAYARERA